MFKKIIFFNTTFSRFLAALASQNKIQFFVKLLWKRRFGENPDKTLDARRKIKVQTLKQFFKNRQKISLTTRPAKASRKTS